MIHNYLEAGKITGTHGIQGELRMQPWSDSPEFFRKIKTFYLDENGTSAVEALSCRPNKSMSILKIKGIDTIEAAEKLRNKTLYIARDDAGIGENDYFICDLIGCRVYDADTDELLGEITDVSQTGANDVWHIGRNGKEYYMPAIKDIVISVDVAKDAVKIRPMKGLFDDEN